MSWLSYFDWSIDVDGPLNFLLNTQTKSEEHIHKENTLPNV